MAMLPSYRVMGKHNGFLWLRGQGHIDIGLESPVKKGVLYSCLKGALDAGLKIPHSEEILPSEERIKGKNPDDYLKVKEIISKNG